MEDGAYSPLDFSLMDELLLDGFWLETTEQSNFWQPTGRPSSSLDSHSFYSQTNNNNLGHFNSDFTTSDQELGKHSNLAQMDRPPVTAGQSQNQEPPILHPDQPQGFVVEGNETNTRLWVGPNRKMTSNSMLVRNRLVQAIEYLKESTRDKDVLIQIWVPIKKGGKNVLTTKNQPFSLNPNHESLALYRHVSKNYQFAIDEEGSKEFVGLPGRVFLKKLPEWTPDVRFFKREEYPRINHAQQYNIGGSIALPVFERGSGTCLGVVEIISTSQIISHRPELEHVCKALEAVDLKSYDILVPPEVKDCSESYQVALAEIKEVLKCVCDMHKLPLAQTWAPCSQQGKGGCRHSDENYVHCVSTIDSACYVRDPQVWDFHVACSEHHLLKGEGVAGGAFATNQPCFATDITAFSKEEYPLSHHAKMFRLCGAVAIRLRCVYSGSADFVLEFFLPLDCGDAEDQKQMLHSLSSVIQQICRSLRVVTDQEFKEETTRPTALLKKTVSLVNKLEKDKSAVAQTSPSKKSSQHNSSWIAMASSSMVDEGKGKGIAFSLDDHKKEPEEEFKLTTFWENNATELPLVSTAGSELQQSSGLKDSASGSSEYSILGDHHFSATRRAGERRRTKTEKTISLQVLRQYFSGSLKDAAKSIGVCPTTLKRICRQHGITRWPSRKIKKVGHSLKKLQLVIDSVQGAEGSIQLSSFYNNFPEFGSTNLASPDQFPTPNPSDNSQKLNSQPENSPAITVSKSPSSSGSHSSSSSFCCSVGATQSAFPVNPSTEPCVGGTLKRARSDAELQNMVQEETKLLVRSRSHKIFTEDVTLEALPPLPKVSNQTVQDGSTFTFRVKATLGEEKIRFSIQPSWGFAYLLQEVKRRFGIDDDTRIDLKYLDDDSEWVLLTCDADLEECIDIHKTSRSRIIKLSLHQPHHPSLPNSFGSCDPS